MLSNRTAAEERGVDVPRGQPRAYTSVISGDVGTTSGIYDVFPDESGREAHLSGPGDAALKGNASEPFVEEPAIEQVDVIAAKPLDRCQVEDVLDDGSRLGKPLRRYEEWRANAAARGSSRRR